MGMVDICLCGIAKDDCDYHKPSLNVIVSSSIHNAFVFSSHSQLRIFLQDHLGKFANFNRNDCRGKLFDGTYMYLCSVNCLLDTYKLRGIDWNEIIVHTSILLIYADTIADEIRHEKFRFVSNLDFPY